MEAGAGDAGEAVGRRGRAPRTAGPSLRRRRQACARRGGRGGPCHPRHRGRWRPGRSLRSCRPPAYPPPCAPRRSVSRRRRSVSRRARLGARRAFGPVEVEVAAGDPEMAVERARQLDLAARIGARVPQERLAAECGEAGAVAARGARAGGGGGAAGARGRRRGGRGGGGRRDPGGVAEFAGLAALGCRCSGAGGWEISTCSLSRRRPRRSRRRSGPRGSARAPGASAHHLAPLFAPAGPAVEIHTRLPGVRLAAGRSATLADLEAAGLLESREPLAPGLVPAARALRAHLLVHALAQLRGLAPAAYRGCASSATCSRWGHRASRADRPLAARGGGSRGAGGGARARGDPGRGRRPAAARPPARRRVRRALPRGAQAHLLAGQAERSAAVAAALAWLRRALCPSAAEPRRSTGGRRGVDICCCSGSGGLSISPAGRCGRS